MVRLWMHIADKSYGKKGTKQIKHLYLRASLSLSPASDTSRVGEGGGAIAIALTLLHRIEVKGSRNFIESIIRSHRAKPRNEWNKTIRRTGSSGPGIIASQSHEHTGSRFGALEQWCKRDMYVCWIAIICHAVKATVHRIGCFANCTTSHHLLVSLHALAPGPFSRLGKAHSLRKRECVVCTKHILHNGNVKRIILRKSSLWLTIITFFWFFSSVAYENLIFIFEEEFEIAQEMSTERMQDDLTYAYNEKKFRYKCSQL